VIRSSDDRGSDLAERFGVSRSLISKIRKGKSWAPQRAASIFCGVTP
jgi:transcriptional regulator with XRE-family HTH domain